MNTNQQLHKIDQQSPMLWLTVHDTEQDICWKLNLFKQVYPLQSFANFDHILACFEHCKDALVILENHIICAVTGRILVECDQKNTNNVENSKEEWMYITVTRARSHINFKKRQCVQNKSKDEYVNMNMHNQTLYIENVRSEAEQEWCIILRQNSTEDEFVSVLASLELMRHKDDTPLHIEGAQYGIFPSIIVSTIRSKSKEIVTQIADIKYVSEVVENKGGHMKHL
jgi:hypothetical protein